MQPSSFGNPMAARQQQQQPEPDSLFAQQPYSTEEMPWWQRNFLLQQPTLVNAWNAVFPTVIVNIFGIVIFLRMGWIVGTAGFFQAVLVLSLCTLFSSVTVLSAIGICERCKIESGGIYFLVSHVLGKQIGGAVGLIYTFGQACATSLVALGFGESMAKLAGVASPAAMKTVSVLVLIVLNALNFAGLRFVIRLQLLLMCFLGLAIGDFLVGALLFTPQDREAGIGPLSSARLSANWYSHYGPANCTQPLPDISGEPAPVPHSAESFFSVFGVLFANFIGVLAGVNMSGNLVDPLRNIAEGELSALAASFGLILVCMLLLGASVDRTALLCDAMISEKMSLTKLVFLGGLYISCLSAILSSTLGTSRVVQGIAQEGLIPQMSRLLQEDTPGRDPQRATVLVTAVAIVLLLLGDLNELAILSSLPFLLTYGMVNYAYVSLAMSHDLASLSQQCASGGRFAENGRAKNCQIVSNGQQANYGSVQEGLAQSGGNHQKSLDALFSATAEDGTGGSNGQAGGWMDSNKPWYHRCINRYVSFAAAIVHLLVMLFVHRWFALLHLLALLGLYFYLGKTCPSVSDQGVSHFSIVHMLRVVMSNKDSWTPFGPSNTAGGGMDGRVVAPPGQGLIRPGDIQPQALNAENPDYAQRKQYHHAEQLGR